MQRPEYDAAVNVVGTVNVLSASPGAQVIFSSSGGAGYGECPVPANEDAPFLPLSPYGIAKKCGEEYLLGWNRIHGTSHVPLRFANVYGPRQDAGLEGGVVAIFLERMARDEPTTIFGDGTQGRDFVYVDDVVAALLASVGKSGGPYNVGTGEATTVAQLHEAAAEVAGVERAALRGGAPRRRAPLGARRRRIERELGLARRRPARRGHGAHVGVDGGARRGVTKQGVPWTHRSRHPRR